MNRDSLQLLPYERHVACLLAALLLGLGIAGFEWRGLLHTETVASTIVKVVGAVEPVEVSIPFGSTVEEVLAQVHVEQEADLTEIDLTKKVVLEKVLVVPYKGKKTFFVQGAVLEPSLVVIEGEVTARKILEKIQVSEEAHLAAFLRRRIFPNGSVIDIKPKKKRSSSPSN